jgi:hypothetical protein
MQTVKEIGSMTEHQQYPPQQHAAASKKRRRWVPWVAYPAVLLLGIIIGSAGGGTDTPAASAPGATTTVTVTKPAPAPKTITQTRVPASCLKALDYADQGFTLAGQALEYASAALTAVGDFDLAKIEEQTAKMAAVNKKVTVLQPRWSAAKAECRAAAK